MTPALRRLKRRPEFLSVAKAGISWATPGLVLQARRRPEPAAGPAIGVGFTASRKVGNAVARNRARRRLRALAAKILPGAGKPGVDYVLIARGGTLKRPYIALTEDLKTALERVCRGAQGQVRSKRRGRDRGRNPKRDRRDQGRK